MKVRELMNILNNLSEDEKDVLIVAPGEWYSCHDVMDIKPCDIYLRYGADGSLMNGVYEDYLVDYYWIPELNQTPIKAFIIK